MSDFINKFSIRFRDKSEAEMLPGINAFIKSIDLVQSAIGKQSFKLSRVINAAVFDSVAVAVALNIHKLDAASVKVKYDLLLGDEEYRKSVSKATANETNVAARFEKAISVFSA